MSSALRLRSMLFVPADSDKKLAKGTASPADVLILDLGLPDTDGMTLLREIPALVAGSWTRSKLNLTASALNGVPSWNLTSRRNVKRHFFASDGSTLHSVARPGTSLPGRSATFISQATSGS